MRLSRMVTLMLAGVVGTLAVASAAHADVPPTLFGPDKGTPTSGIGLLFTYMKADHVQDEACDAHGQRVTFSWDGRVFATMAPVTQGYGCAARYYGTPPGWGSTPGRHGVRASSTEPGNPTAGLWFTITGATPSRTTAASAAARPAGAATPATTAASPAVTDPTTVASASPTPAAVDPLSPTGTREVVLSGDRRDASQPLAPAWSYPVGGLAVIAGAGLGFLAWRRRHTPPEAPATDEATLG